MKTGLRRCPALVVLACGLALSSGAFARDGVVSFDERPGFLQLKTGEVATAALPNLLVERPVAFQVDRYYVLQLDGVLTPAREAALRALGVRRYDYLPTNAFVVKLGGVAPAALAGLGFVAWVGDYRDEWRIDPEIGTHVFQTAARIKAQAAGDVLVSTYLFEDAAIGPALEAIARIPGARVANEDLEGGAWVVNVRTPGAGLAAIATIPSVQYIEEYPELTFRNLTTRWIVQSNVNGQYTINAKGIHGEGQILGHMDGQVAEPHCSFDDTDPIGDNHRKIQAYNEAQGYDQHGTHTAGTAVGDGLNDATNTRGVAYLARMVHHGIPAFSDSGMYNRLNQHYGQGATVHTNSWGNDGTTAYDGLCRGIDRFSHDFEDNLVCFAVTNSSLLKNPENAKNCLAVGASQDTPNQGSHCSGGDGPTNDGRRKPEVYAPGCSSSSSSGSSGCGTASLTGTSMACPAVSGAGLLVRQYFTDGFYPSGQANASDAFIPSGALIKSMLINSSVDMTGVSGYPSNREGWGRVLLENSMAFTTDTRKVIVEDVRNDDGMATGAVIEGQFEVTGSTEQLRVTMVFCDAPAAINANPAAVNNIDLEVVKPDGTLYKGNVFSGGVSVTGGSADTKNNVEQVHLSTPPVGIWTWRIRGTNIPTGPQGYSMVISGQVDVDVICPADCDGDTICDSQEIAQGAPDCNANGVPDDCDVDPNFGGSSSDCQGDGVPDECQLVGNDCDNNGNPDDCQGDCDNDGITDPCEIAFGFDTDCDGDGLPDDCEVFTDCNGNDVPDDCDDSFCEADLAAPFGVLNVFDFLAFQTLFSNADPCADLAAPIGTFNVFDFLAFQTSFGNGC